MNLKKIIALTLVLVLLVPFGAYAKTLEITINEKDMYVQNGPAVQKLELLSAPCIENGRTMVPVRVISECFEADVDWDGTLQKVSIYADGNVITLTIGSTTAYVNSQPTELDCAPFIKDGSTMVPVRFVSEALKKDVSFLSSSSQVLITDEEPVVTVNSYPITLDDYRFMYLYYCLTQGFFEPDASVAGISEMLVQNALLRDEAVKDGFSLHPTQEAELAKSILADKDIYYNFSLVAPGIKTFSDMLTSNEYLNKNAMLNVNLEDIQEIYQKDYVYVKHILIPTIDLDTGKELSTTKVRAAKALADSVYKEAASGEDFDTLIEKYNEDMGSEYVFTYGEMVEEFEKAAFSLDENEISKVVKSPYGYHIIQRLPLPAATYEVESAIAASLVGTYTEEYVSKLKEKADIKVNISDEEIADILTATQNNIIEFVLGSMNQPQ